MDSTAKTIFPLMANVFANISAMSSNATSSSRKKTHLGGNIALPFTSTQYIQSVLIIKKTLLELVEQRAYEFLADAPPTLPARLATGVAEVNKADQQLLAQAGYRKTLGQYRMEIEMYEQPLLPALPNGIAVRTCLAEQDRRVIYETEMEAFANPEGYPQFSFEQWEHYHVKLENFDPSLWFLAFEGETLVGICLCKYWLDAGFVSPLAVRRPWRRRGIGTALLRRSFAEFYRRGTHTVKLMVDTENPRATELYERAGMWITQLYYQYAKELRP
jgi:mycothiol synthase